MDFAKNKKKNNNKYKLKNNQFKVFVCYVKWISMFDTLLHFHQKDQKIESSGIKLKTCWSGLYSFDRFLKWSDHWLPDMNIKPKATKHGKI